jgi:hypothetical protein
MRSKSVVIKLRAAAHASEGNPETTTASTALTALALAKSGINFRRSGLCVRWGVLAQNVEDLVSCTLFISLLHGGEFARKSTGSPFEYLTL